MVFTNLIGRFHFRTGCFSEVQKLLEVFSGHLYAEQSSLKFKDNPREVDLMTGVPLTETAYDEWEG